MKSKRSCIVIGLVIIGVAVGIAHVGQRVRQIRDAGERSVCTGRLKYLASAIQQYHRAHQQMPPAYLVGPDGKRWHSWRALLLPYLDEDDIARQYRFDEPWNGPNNIRLANRLPKGLSCLSDKEGATNGVTNYFVIVGKGTAFPDEGRVFPFPWANGLGLPRVSQDDQRPLLRKDGQALLQSPRSMTFGDFPRPSETLLIVESAGRGIIWLEPRDLELSELSFVPNDPISPSFSSLHRVPMAAMVDGSVHPLAGLDAVTLRRMCLVDPDKVPEPKNVGPPIAE